jgi:hypothetical protein
MFPTSQKPNHFLPSDTSQKSRNNSSALLSRPCMKNPLKHPTQRSLIHFPLTRLILRSRCSNLLIGLLLLCSTASISPLSQPNSIAKMIRTCTCHFLTRHLAHPWAYANVWLMDSILLTTVYYSPPTIWEVFISMWTFNQAFPTHLETLEGRKCCNGPA